MTLPTPGDLAQRLAEHAEAVCRRYLPNGSRSGNYWSVGDVYGTQGASLYVRLTGPTSGRRAMGRWADAATGEHGDLIDLIRINQGHDDWRETLEEARAFLSMPLPVEPQAPVSQSARDTGEAARALFRAGRAMPGTPAATYLGGRGLSHAIGLPALRYHPLCNHRLEKRPTRQLPAMLAAVSDLSGRITGLSRTWLAPDGRAKADLAEPRRTLGALHGNGVRFPGTVPDILVAGEGLETVLSVHRMMPAIPHVAALSAAHLAALILPDGLRRLYVARDADAAGERAFAKLQARAEKTGILVFELVPAFDDFNDDLVRLGSRDMALNLAPQLAEDDAVAFLRLEEASTSAA